MQRRRFFQYGAVGLSTLGLTLLIGWWQVDGPGAPASSGKRPVSFSDMDFRLTDHEGNEVGPDTVIGRPTMVFFGFTYCPDVCPTTLSDISSWLDEIGKDAELLHVIFITIDPERDTVGVMAKYVEYFHPSIRGWTGPEDQIARAVKGFRAYYEKVPTNGENYTMNHTAGVFLFNAEGRFVSVVDYHESKEVAVPKIRRALRL